MEEIFAVILQALIEILAQVFLEILLQSGVTFIKDSYEIETVKPLILVFCYVFCGLGLGILSSLIFPQMFINGKKWKNAAIIIMPILTGLFMCFWSWWRNRLKNSENSFWRWDDFLYGWSFGFCFSVIRYWFLLTSGI